MTTRETFIITIEAGDHPTAPAIRLRQWLKIGLRAFGLRVVDVSEQREVQPIVHDKVVDTADGRTR